MANPSSGALHGPEEVTVGWGLAGAGGLPERRWAFKVNLAQSVPGMEMAPARMSLLLGL